MAERSDLHLDRLVGRRVHDRNGRVVGRIEEFRAEREGEHWVIARYRIGPEALLERLAVRHFGFTWRRRPYGYDARWDQLDIDDPDRPQLTVPVEELEAIRR